MSTAALVSFRAPVLAWADSADDARLFRRVTWAVLLVTAGLCLTLLLSPKPKEDKSQAQALPPPMAKLLLEHTPPPLPEVPPKAEPERQADTAQPTPAAPGNKPEPTKAAAPRKQAVANEAPAPAGVIATPAPADNGQAGAVEAARRKVAGLGLLAAKDDIAQVRGGSVGVQVKTDIRQGSGVGGGATTTGGSPGGADVGTLARSMITSNSSGGTGTINTAAYSRNVNGGGLATRATTVVEDTPSARGAGAAGKRGGAGAGGSAGKPPRSPEDIRLVLARNKGSLDAIYNRALREDPTLQGKVVVELKIAPTGEVLSCRVVFSDLHAPELEAKLVARIRMIDFGSKDVDTTVEKYPLDFLPS